MNVCRKKETNKGREKEKWKKEQTCETNKCRKKIKTECSYYLQLNIFSLRLVQRRFTLCTSFPVRFCIKELRVAKKRFSWFLLQYRRGTPLQGKEYSPAKWICLDISRCARWNIVYTRLYGWDRQELGTELTACHTNNCTARPRFFLLYREEMKRENDCGWGFPKHKNRIFWGNKRDFHVVFETI